MLNRQSFGWRLRWRQARNRWRQRWEFVEVITQAHVPVCEVRSPRDCTYAAPAVSYGAPAVTYEELPQVFQEERIVEEIPEFAMLEGVKRSG